MKISELIKKLFKKEIGLDLSNPEHLKLVKKAYGSYRVFRNIYLKMYRYYRGDTDAIRKYLFVTERSNLKINTNYIKKFIREEVAYTVGNDITYESRSDNDEIVENIEYYTAHWNELHDSDLMKYLLIFTKVYEIYYIDVYTSDKIYHFDSKFNEISQPTENIFGEVPVTIGDLTEEGVDDSLYKDLKGLQDAFETNLSDIGNEISDFRNAYLLFKNASVEPEKIPEMKKLGIIQLKNKNSDASWLIKNVNDTFIQNTLDRYEDVMYQLACHINHNEKLQSNLSGIALRSRLIVLENKCSLEIKAHKNMVKNRIRFLFKYLDIKKNKKFDYKDVKFLYTPNIPSDDLATAQMLAQLPEGVVSKDTGRGLLSFVNNKVAEGKKVDEENQEEMKSIPDLEHGDE